MAYLGVNASAFNINYVEEYKKELLKEKLERDEKRDQTGLAVPITRNCRLLTIVPDITINDLESFYERIISDDDRKRLLRYYYHDGGIRSNSELVDLGGYIKKYIVDSNIQCKYKDLMGELITVHKILSFPRISLGTFYSHEYSFFDPIVNNINIVDLDKCFI